MQFSPLCIQDPFVLNHNIASNINEKIKQLLLQELVRAAVVCAPDEHRGGSGGLVRLLESDEQARARSEICAEVKGQDSEGLKETMEVKFEVPANVCSSETGYSFKLKMKRL